MPVISTWADLAASAGAYLNAAQPLEAMKEAGFTFDGEVGKAMAVVKPIRPLNAIQFKQLDTKRQQLPQVPVTLSIAEPAGPPVVERTVVGGYRAAAAIDMQSVNAVVSDLWSAGKLPSSFSTDKLSLTILSGFFTNVPTDSSAQLGPITISAPPSFSPSATSTTNVLLNVPIALTVSGDSPSTLTAVIVVDLPLEAQLYKDSSTPPKQRLALSSDAATSATATLTVDASSQMQLQAASLQAGVNLVVTSVIQNLMGSYTAQPYTAPSNAALTLPAQYINSTLPNTVFELMSAAGVTNTFANNQQVLIAGVNIDGGVEPFDPTQLVNVGAPSAPFNLHAEIDESMATAALMMPINSGDLSAYLNHLASKHLDGLIPALTVTNGSVSFQGGSITLSMHIEANKACIGLTSLGMTVSVSGPPVISNGRISFGAQNINVSVDVGSSLLCFLLTSLLGGITGLFAAGVFIYADTADFPFSLNSYPATYPIGPLPGTEDAWVFTLEQASANNGTLTLDGTAEVGPDPRYLIYLQVFTTLDGVESPLRNGAVTLMELDDPAPAGDDVAIPQTGTSIVKTAVGIDVTTKTYLPSADQTLGSQTTDDEGNVRFLIDASTLNTIGGVLRTQETITNLKVGMNPTTSTIETNVGERLPDFGVMVADSDGNVLVSRQLVALNVSGKRVGSLANPVKVVVPEVVSDPRILLYLQFFTSTENGEVPLQNATVTLFELDDPAPAGDDVAVPQTGITITKTAVSVTATSKSYQPSPDQLLGTQVTDSQGNVQFIVDPATLNNLGGVLTTTVSSTNLKTGQSSSNTTTAKVLERLPDFGVTVVDARGTVRVTRELVALNLSGNRVGAPESPFKVFV